MKELYFNLPFFYHRFNFVEASRVFYTMPSSAGFDVINLPIYMICSVGVVANLMLLIAFVKDPLKCFRNSATYLVGNLALSDLSYNVLFMVNISLSSEHKIAYLTLYVLFYSSLATIFSIALDRFLLITYPFKHRILMSDKKMAAWIAITWFLSFIHALKKIFVQDMLDDLIKPGIGSLLIILTGILYGKAYFTLKKQNRSMVGLKAKSSSQQSRNTRVSQVGTSQSGNERSENEIDLSQTSRAQSQDDRAQSQDDRAQSQNEHAQSENERAQSQHERAQSQDKRAQSQDERQSQNKHAHDRAQIEDEHSQNTRDKAQNQDYRTQIKRDIRDSSTTKGIHEEISLQSSSSKMHRKPQSVNSAKEQRFLNTVIIIAGIAVLTVLVGTVFVQLDLTVLKKRPEMSRILKSVCFTIFCFNFAANPFVYCLRLNQYRKTFQIVYWNF